MEGKVLTLLVSEPTREGGPVVCEQRRTVGDVMVGVYGSVGTLQITTTANAKIFFFAFVQIVVHSTILPNQNIQISKSIL